MKTTYRLADVNQSPLARVLEAETRTDEDARPTISLFEDDPFDGHGPSDCSPREIGGSR